MKTLFCMTVVTMLLLMLTPHAEALFNHVQAEKERRQEAEQRIVQEQQHNGQLFQTNQGLHTTISILSAGISVALIVGAAVGSKTRRDVNQP